MKRPINDRIACLCPRNDQLTKLINHATSVSMPHLLISKTESQCQATRGPLRARDDHPPLHRPYAYWSFCIFSTYRQEGLPEDPYYHLPQAQPNAQYSQILNGSVQCLHLGSSVIMSLFPPGLRLAICFFKKTHLSNSVRL